MIKFVGNDNKECNCLDWKTLLEIMLKEQMREVIIVSVDELVIYRVHKYEQIKKIIEEGL
jgi:hypothetical protein